MHVRSLLLCLLLVVCPHLVAGESHPVVIGHSQQMHSTVLDEERSYSVSLPVGYASSDAQRYPVLYVLDGEEQFPLAVATTRFLAAQGEIPETIVVGIDSTVRVRDFTQTDWPEMWVGGGGADNFARFLGKELLPKIEGDYRTDGYRILEGHSSGGQFALHALAAHPGLFRAYIVLSPSLDWDHGLPQRELQEALDAAKSHPAFVYFAYGNDYAQPLADDKALEATLAQHVQDGFRASSRHFPKESHTGITFLSQFDGLRTLYAGYGLSNDVLRDANLAFVEQHYRDVSKSLGWHIAVPETVINTLAYNALGNGRVQDAIALFLRSTKSHPGSANAWDSLADGYEKAGQLPQAVSAVDKAVALATRDRLPNRDAYERHAHKVQVKLQASKARVQSEK